MVKLVDTLVLGTSAFGRGGSTPSRGTMSFEFIVRRNRILISRFFSALFLFFLFTSSTAWFSSQIYFYVFISLGFIFIWISVVGRIWASIYLSGYKDNKIINVGPFSMVRNPLYVFSLAGLIGIGLTTASFIMLGSMLVVYFLIYNHTISSEEFYLYKKFGPEYSSYQLKTNRLLPSKKNYFEPPEYKIKTKFVMNSVIDAMWFVVGFLFLLIIHLLHYKSLLPVFFNLY